MEISLEKAKTEKLFYFVVTGTVFNRKLKKCLILKRSEKETAHPGLWGVIGGKLEWNDLRDNPPTRQNFSITDWEGLVEKVLQREAMEEANIEVGNSKYLNSVVYLRPDNVPVVCFKFAVEYQKGEIKISHEFDDFAWVNESEIKKYQHIQGIDQEIRQTINLYTS